MRSNVGFQKVKCDVDEQLPLKRIRLFPCNVFNFTLIADVASEWMMAGGCLNATKPRG